MGKCHTVICRNIEFKISRKTGSTKYNFQDVIDMYYYIYIRSFIPGTLNTDLRVTLG